MIRIDLPFYFQFIDSFQLKPLIIRDRMGTEIWFLNVYFVCNVTKQGEASHEYHEHQRSGKDQ